MARTGWRAALSTGLGLLLIALGLFGWHVEVGAIVVGCLLLGFVSLDVIVNALRAPGRVDRDDQD